MLASLVINRYLNFVRFVNVKVVPLVDPTVVPRRLGAPFNSIFDLNVDESLGSSTKATGSCMVNIGNCVNRQGKVTAERFSLTRYTQAVVCNLNQ